jgi:hypothetical protein
MYQRSHFSLIVKMMLGYHGFASAKYESFHNRDVRRNLGSPLYLARDDVYMHYVSLVSPCCDYIA